MKPNWLLLRLFIRTRRERNHLRQALRAEQAYSLALESQLEGERWRNQSREDELLTVPMRSLGMYGVATRSAPAPPRDPLRRQINRSISKADPWAMLTDEERAEWPLYQADADPDGTHTAAVRREFLQMIEMRRSENDTEIM